MKMAQKAPDKVQAIIDDNKKIDILVAFKAAYPNAVIDLNELGPIDEVIVEPEGPTDEELAAIKETEAKAKAEADKAAKKAELEAQLAALDG